MRIVRDRRGDRAALEPIALQIAQPDVAGALVALYHGDFQNIALRIHALGVAVVGRDDLPGHHADHGAALRAREVLRTQPSHAEGIVRLGAQLARRLRGSESTERAVFIGHAAVLEHRLHLEMLERIDDRKVGPVARRDRAMLRQTEVFRRIPRRSRDRRDRVDAARNRFFDDIVDVPQLQQVDGVLVVRAEHTALRARLLEQVDQRLEILRRRAVADHDVLPGAQLLARVVDGKALVVGTDARRRIGL